MDEKRECFAETVRYAQFRIPHLAFSDAARKIEGLGQKNQQTQGDSLCRRLA
jgi:hypothetical protein